MTGGTGLLGNEIKKQKPDVISCSTIDFDIADYSAAFNFIKQIEPDILLHCAAFTSPPKIDQEPVKAIDSNIIGTANLVKICHELNIKLIYISTDYVFRGDKGNYTEEDPVYPVNKYAWSKLGGECAVRLYDNSLIIRTTFGPNVFPYPKAFTDQWTSRESVTNTASMIISLLDKDICGTIHVGGKRKTVFEYAKSLDQEKDIIPISINDIAFKVPADSSLDCTKFDLLTDIYNKI